MQIRWLSTAHPLGRNYCAKRLIAASHHPNPPRLAAGLPRTHLGYPIAVETFTTLSGLARNINASVSQNFGLVYDVIAAIDIKGFAGDKLGRVVCEEGSSDANVIDTDEAANGSLRLRFVK